MNIISPRRPKKYNFVFTRKKKMAIIYRGFSKRSGRIKSLRSGKSEKRDIIRLYGMFDKDTIITCIDSKNKAVLER